MSCIVNKNRSPIEVLISGADKQIQYQELRVEMAKLISTKNSYSDLQLLLIYQLIMKDFQKKKKPKQRDVQKIRRIW